MFYSGSSLELKSKAVNELNIFFDSLRFSGKDESVPKKYLQDNWYDEYYWELWGRRHLTKVSLSRTTMKVEAHWSILKRLYLFSFNRPRVDLLIHILESKIMRKYSDDYKAYCEGYLKPWWWKEFLKSWKTCSKEQLNRNYITNSNLFICSCLAWQRSQDFFCKHLVHGQEPPEYGQVTLRRSPLFIIVDRKSKRTRANIDEEEDGAHIHTGAPVLAGNLL